MTTILMDDVTIGLFVLCLVEGLVVPFLAYLLGRHHAENEMSMGAYIGMQSNPKASTLGAHEENMMETDPWNWAAYSSGGEDDSAKLKNSKPTMRGE